jgi:hypothetical protein
MHRNDVFIFCKKKSWPTLNLGLVPQKVLKLIPFTILNPKLFFNIAKSDRERLQKPRDKGLEDPM